MIETLTRRQLQVYGLSKYQTATITKDLAQTGKEGRSSTFKLTEVIEAIRKRLNSSRLRQNTREVCTFTLTQLLERLGNVVEIPLLSNGNLEIRKAGAQLLHAIVRTDAALADLKADADEIQARYKAAP